MKALQRANRNHEAAILSRLVQAGHATFPPELAHVIVSLQFSSWDVERMNALAAKARAGSLTADEREEVDSYERVGSFLGLLQSKARQSLKKSRPARKS